MTSLKYLSAYSPQVQSQVQTMLDKDRLGEFLLKKYPTPHAITSDGALREYVMDLKSQFMRKSGPLSKVVYDNKIHVVNHALGLHTYKSQVQGGKLKSKNEIRVSTLFKKAPEPLLSMITVHELAHLKEKTHNKAFYSLCEHMLPDYHQLEFETRLYLTQVELKGAIY
jgi:predicted metal-dependent hydrolase